MNVCIKARLRHNFYVKLVDCSRLYSTQRDLNAILNGMASRTSSLHAGPKMPPISAAFSKQFRFPVGTKVNVGDVVLVGLEPMVLIASSSNASGMCTLVDRVGQVTHMPLHQTNMWLSEMIPSSFLEANISKLLTNEISAPLQVSTAENSKALSESVSLNNMNSGETTQVVNVWVHRLISKPLRKLKELASLKAGIILEDTLKEFQLFQKSEDGELISFSDFMKRVFKRDTFSAIETLAARLCLEHSQMKGQYDAKLNLLKPKIIRIDSTKKYSDKNLYSLPTEYARGNLADPLLQSRAVMQLKKSMTQLTSINPSVASEVLKLPYGGIRDCKWYNWALKDKQKHMEINKDICKERLKFEGAVYCIDNSDAAEIDDGISIENLSSTNVRIGVHIADPSAFLNIADTVNVIKQNPSTVYLDKLTIPMLPSKVTTQFDVSKSQAPSLSLFVDLDKTTGHVLDFKIQNTMLTSTQKITPAEVNANSVSNYSSFLEVAEALRRSRFTNGAFGIKKYSEFSGNASTDSSSVLTIDGQVPGSFIVAEFMILASHLVGTYCYEHDIPVLYRGQDLMLSSKNLRDAFYKYFKENDGMIGFEWLPIVQQKYISCEPKRHTGLGFDVLTSFTSPLRRFEDFLTHAQLNSHLNNRRLPFSKADLQNWRDELEMRQHLITQLQKEDKRFVNLKKLQAFSSQRSEQKVTGVISRVTVTSSTEREVNVYLPAFDLDVEYTGKNTELAVEQAAQFTIRHVSPEGRYAYVE